MAGRQREKSLQRDISVLRRKVQTCEAAQEREWRGLVASLQEECARLTSQLRAAQYERSSVLGANRRKDEELAGAARSFAELQGAAEEQIDEVAKKCLQEASAQMERRLKKAEDGAAAASKVAEASFAKVKAELEQLKINYALQAGQLEAARERSTKAAKELYNTTRREERAQEAKTLMQEERVRPPPNTAAWKSRYTAKSKWYLYFKRILGPLDWDEDALAGLSKALYVLGLIDLLWGTKYFDIVYFDNVQTLLAEMEHDVFGIDFGLFLHLELHMTLDQITKLALVTQKAFDGKHYRFRSLMRSEHRHSLEIRVPRITPLRGDLEPVIKELKASTGFDLAENGRISWRPVMPLISAVLEEDCGNFGMPELGYFLAGNVLDLVVSQDATGFGSLSIATCVLNNPYTPHSAQNLRILGLGNVDDGKDGTTKLLQENRELLNRLIRTEGAELVEVPVAGGVVKILLNVLVVSDLSSTRKCEKLLCSGHCGCAQAALRLVFKAPENEDQLRLLAKKCFAPNLKQRTILGHRRFDGKVWPCFAAGCNFGHSDQPEVEYVVEHQCNQRLLADLSKPGVARYDKYRLDHAHKHFNVQPHSAGEQTYDVSMKTQQVPDSLHANTLNLPKPWWGHGVLRNASGARSYLP